MINYPLPPIARVPGHRAGCFDGCGNYRSCEPNCPAQRDWNKVSVRDAAYEAHDVDMAKFRKELDEAYPATESPSEEKKT